MANISRMTGTPWHVETLKMKEGDTARHCHRCIYYSKNNRFCSAIMGSCFGSAHCEYYSKTRIMPSIISDGYALKNIPADINNNKKPTIRTLCRNITSMYKVSNQY